MKRKLNPGGLGILLIVMIAVGVVTLLSTEEINRSWRWEEHTYEVLVEFDRLLSALVDIETAERGFVISGDQRFLEPFNTALPQIHGRMDKLRRLTIDNPLQQERLDQLGPLIIQRIAETNRVITARTNGESEAARERISHGEGKRLMDAIRQNIVETKTVEQRLLTDRDRAVQTALQREQNTVFGGSIFGLGIVATALVLANRERRDRRKAEASERRALRILNCTLDSVFMFDVRTLRFFYVNDGAVRQLGYPREDLLGMTPLDFEPGFDESRYRATIAPLLDGSIDAQLLSSVYRRKDGREVPVEIVLQCGESAAGQQAMVAIVRDVTERRQAGHYRLCRISRGR